MSCPALRQCMVLVGESVDKGERPRGATEGSILPTTRHTCYTVPDIDASYATKAEAERRRRDKEARELEEMKNLQ
eukprot:3373357-Rhodomonas_salina.2